MMQDEPISQEDRVMVAKLFKEIAAYGRRVRERRALKSAAVQETVPSSQPHPVSEEEKQAS